MRRTWRFVAGVAVGGGAFAGYLAFVGVGSVVDRAAGVAPWAFVAVCLLVVAEALADSLGVWASVRPLAGGVTPGKAVQLALAGDFFDTLSPAGPVSSEPIVARFVGVETGTTYGGALGVRTVAKYVKSGTQLLVSTLVGVAFLFDGGAARALTLTLGGTVVGVVVAGAVAVRSRAALSRLVVPVAAPVVHRVSSLYRDDPHGRGVVADAVERFWSRALRFRGEPELVGLVALAGVVEQVLTAAALWTALAGTGVEVALLPVLAVVPLPQVASAVPVPGSLGAYDVLLGGALVLATGAPEAAAAAAVVLLRTVGLPFGLASGGLAVAFLRGWRPS